MDIKSILSFFDANSPCPENIGNCEKLREQYVEELNKSRDMSCKQCIDLQLRDKYLKLILSK
jgi:hypothetical protein